MTDNVTLLLVDDLEANLVAMAALLSGPGLRLLKARSGEEALELLLAHEVALALVDVQMPGMDGFELAELMRGSERTKHVPIVFVTAGAHDRKRMFRGYDSGAVDFLYKPIEPHILTNKVNVFAELFRQKQALARVSAYARSLIEASLDPLVTISAEGKITDVNEGSIKVTGMAREKLIGTDFSDYFTEPEKARDGYHQVFAKGFVTDYPLTIRHKDGRLTDVLYNASVYKDMSGNVLGVFAAARDVTARKQAAEVQSRLGAIVSSADDGILSKALDGVVTTWNASAERLFGYTAAEIIGNPNLHLTPPELLHEEEYILEQILAGNAVKHFETQRMTKDGRRLPVSLTISPIKDATGNVVGASKIVRDITERNADEESLRLTAEELARTARAKDDFLAALSHELRTPLTPVLMTASALAVDPTLPMEVREQLSMMRRNIELEARLIDDLLDFTTISRGKLILAPVITDLHALLGHTHEIIGGDGLGTQVRIVLRLEARRHHARVDPTRMQQVFWNLLKNAVKFTPGGGSISVSTVNDADGRIVIRVEDNGIGMGAGTLPHIFNAFEQGAVAGQHRFGGLGLGLAISQAIITAHDGELRAESEGLNCGSTFTAVLATSDAPAATAAVTEPGEVPARTRKLLIVEDHEATRQVLQRLLTIKGHQVTIAGTVREALAIHGTERFDAVISDLGLPDGSGLDLMRELQRQRPVPGIALSGYGMEEDLRLTREAGFFAHLVKPVNLDQLRQLIEQIPPQSHD